MLYAALESSYAFKHEPGNQMLPMKLPKVRMKNIYFKHLSAQPVKLTLAEYGVRAEASALSYGTVEPADMIIDGVWSDQPARILPMLENVHLTGSEDWVIKVKNFDCRIDVAEDDTIAPSENIAFDLPLVWLLRDPELYFENRINVFDEAARETEANRLAAAGSATAADSSAGDAADSAAAAAQSAREAQAIAHLTIDAAPTADSANPVASGGVKTALDGKKNTQSAVSDPTASGNALAFIDSVSQNAQGVITPTKKTVQSASQSQAGVMSAADKTKLDGLSRAITADLGTITGTGSAVTVTKTVPGVTEDMTPDRIELGTQEAVLSSITIITAANSVTFSAVVKGSTTVKVKLSGNTDVTGT